MKLTVVLCRQSERWIRKEMWKNRKTLRKVGNYYVSPALLEKGVQIHEAMDVAAPESTLEPAEYPEPHCVPVEQRRDCSHPDWHDREAYIVHHKTRLLEGDRHMCLLTKTIRYEGLPLVLEGGISSLSEDLSEQSREAILQAHLWDCTQIKLPKKLDITKPHWSFPREYGVPIRRKVEMVLAHYNLLCEKVTSQLPGAMDRTILKNLEARVPVQKGDGNLLVLRSLLDTLVTSKEPLAAFSTPEEVRATVEMDLPDLYPVKYTLDLERSNIYKMDTLFPAPRRMMNEHPHTLHVTHPYNYFWFPHQKLARAILACFTFAASRARQLYGVSE